jgi:hypothetical protein
MDRLLPTGEYMLFLNISNQSSLSVIVPALEQAAYLPRIQEKVP